MENVEIPETSLSLSYVACSLTDKNVLPDTLIDDDGRSHYVILSDEGMHISIGLQELLKMWNLEILFETCSSNTFKNCFKDKMILLNFDF